MARKKQCNHKMTRYDWGRDATGAEVAISRWCLGCGAQLGIGDPNDEPEAVQREIRDAESIAEGVTLGCSEADFWDEEGSSFRFVEFPDDWSWDPSRPIAEQLAETARNDAEADAMEYEVTRDAEPDCRDEDDTDEAVVCSCAGDALRSERCGGES